VTVDYSEISEALREVFNIPDAERPYLKLAKAYAKQGMKEEEESVMFLVNKRFKKTDDNCSDPNKE
jgi:hypothetical protein